MKRIPIRVEPISTYLERRRKGPIYPAIVAGQEAFGLTPGWASTFAYPA